MDRTAVATDGTPSDPARPAGPQPPLMEEELNLGRYLAILRRHWLTLFVGVFVGGAAGVVSASLRPVLYEGVTTILIGRSNSVIATATSRALLENRTLAAETLAEIGSSVSSEVFVTNQLTIEQVPSTNVMKVRVKFEDAAKAAQASRVLSQKAVELNRRVASEEGSAVRGRAESSSGSGRRAPEDGRERIPSLRGPGAGRAVEAGHRTDDCRARRPVEAAHRHRDGACEAGGRGAGNQETGSSLLVAARRQRGNGASADSGTDRRSRCRPLRCFVVSRISRHRFEAAPTSHCPRDHRPSSRPKIRRRGRARRLGKKLSSARRPTASFNDV